MESVYIGILGCVIGIIIFYGVSYFVNFVVLMIFVVISGGEVGDLSYIFFYILVSFVIIVVVICGGVVVIFGMNLVRKVIKINVLIVLRREL